MGGVVHKWPVRSRWEKLGVIPIHGAIFGVYQGLEIEAGADSKLPSWSYKKALQEPLMRVRH